jgi:hypothetical protein
VKPPERSQRKDGDLEKAPVARSLAMALIGFVAVVWSLATLLTQ